VRSVPGACTTKSSGGSPPLDCANAYSPAVAESIRRCSALQRKKFTTTSSEGSVEVRVWISSVFKTPTFLALGPMFTSRSLFGASR